MARLISLCIPSLLRRRRNCAIHTILMSREGWRLAMDISVYSFVAVSRAAAELMPEGGAIITLSYYGGEKVVPGYNVMGVCKAALEHSVRYLAWDLGREKIRVNCISAGPMHAKRGRHRGLRPVARARRGKIALGPQYRTPGPRRHGLVSARRSVRRSDGRNHPRRLRLQHRGTVARDWEGKGMDAERQIKKHQLLDGEF